MFTSKLALNNSAAKDMLLVIIVFLAKDAEEITMNIFLLEIFFTICGPDFQFLIVYMAGPIVLGLGIRTNGDELYNKTCVLRQC